MLSKTTIGTLILLLIILILMPMSMVFVALIMIFATTAALDAKNAGFVSKIFSLFENKER